MCGKRVSILGRRDRALPDGCKAERGRPCMGEWAIAAAAIVLAIFSLQVETVAQVPGPESFAQEPRTPMELWSAIDYLTRTGQSQEGGPVP